MQPQVCQKSHNNACNPRGKPSIAGLPPLENSPPDCFQFTPCPSSSKTLRCGAERGFRALRGATKGLRALWKLRQLGSAGSAFFGRLRRPHETFSTNGKDCFTQSFPNIAIKVLFLHSLCGEPHAPCGCRASRRTRRKPP